MYLALSGSAGVRLRTQIAGAPSSDQSVCFYMTSKLFVYFFLCFFFFFCLMQDNCDIWEWHRWEEGPYLRSGFLKAEPEMGIHSFLLLLKQITTNQWHKMTQICYFTVQSTEEDMASFKSKCSNGWCLFLDNLGESVSFPCPACRSCLHSVPTFATFKDSDLHLYKHYSLVDALPLPLISAPVFSFQGSL